MKDITFGAGIASLALLLLVSGAHAASTLSGSAVQEDGSVKTVSNTSNADPADDFGAIVFDDANGTTFSSLTALSTDFNVTDDNCGGGSPRFQIRMDTDNDGNSNGNIFVYLGPTPNFNTCTQNSFVNSGNLIGSTDARFDLTQFGGAFYATYADALALLGDDTILRISLATDGGWSQGDGEQTILYDNVKINGTTYDFPALVGPATHMDQCKNGGWRNFNNPTYKNQGDCVSATVGNRRTTQ